ncbi:hypothetical protein [Tabrizicola sp. BL-A-41-H6]|uniref:hypothetical protein n=1 Tax=Tabrizicola sp. BL-A-41-H6 TaxID=3421107 RepID=UPI003D66D935
MKKQTPRKRHGLTQAIFADANAYLGRQSHHPALGNDWFFDIKAHIGVDANGGEAPSTEREEALQGVGKGLGVIRKALKCGNLHPLNALSNRIIPMVRARVEHTFQAVRRQFGHVNTRYRCLARS